MATAPPGDAERGFARRPNVALPVELFQVTGDPDADGPPYHRICSECKVRFEARKPTAETCSARCRKRRFQRRKAAEARSDARSV